MNTKFLLLLFALTLSLEVAFSLSKLKSRQRFNATDFVFNLSSTTPSAIGAGGIGRAMNVDTFPVLENEGLAAVFFILKPCGINLPHVHQRATELFIVIKGTFKTAFVEENSGRTIVTTLTTGQATIFPQGLIHEEQNIGCDEAMFVSAFNNEDPGLATTLLGLNKLPDDALQSTLGQNQDFVNKLRSGAPVNPAAGNLECLKRCGLAK